MRKLIFIILVICAQFFVAYNAFAQFKSRDSINPKMMFEANYGKAFPFSSFANYCESGNSVSASFNYLIDTSVYLSLSLNYVKFSNHFVQRIADSEDGSGADTANFKYNARTFPILIGLRKDFNNVIKNTMPYLKFEFGISVINIAGKCNSNNLCFVNDFVDSQVTVFHGALSGGIDIELFPKIDLNINARIDNTMGNFLNNAPYCTIGGGLNYKFE